MAIEDLLRQEFNCDNLLVLSTDEYHCDQRNKVSTLRVIMATYYAKDRVQHFYFYLRTENVSLFDGAVKVSEDEAVSMLVPNSDFSMVSMYVIVVIILFCGIVVFVMMIVLAFRKFKFRNKSLK